MSTPLNLNRPTKPKLVSAKDAAPAPVSSTEPTLTKPATGQHVQLQFQVPPEIRRAVKAYAAENDTNMSDLFMRMWSEYRSRHS
ncbi:hypothetical protein [Methylorubrum sp. SB2]|uniref:hypothetical protein n=1 Tax=Methylorubrum subtropicum TaxID=3138812 RepID=UPI00313F3010